MTEEGAMGGHRTRRVGQLLDLRGSLPTEARDGPLLPQMQSRVLRRLARRFRLYPRDRCDLRSTKGRSAGRFKIGKGRF